jgi:pimeloyl-ACP methyl ester carboxylesterase
MHHLKPVQYDRHQISYAATPPPVLVVWGARDRFQPRAAGLRLHALLRGASWLELPDAGHFVPEEQSETLAAAVHAFAAKVPDAR